MYFPKLNDKKNGFIIVKRISVNRTIVNFCNHITLYLLLNASNEPEGQTRESLQEYDQINLLESFRILPMP